MKFDIRNNIKVIPNKKYIQVAIAHKADKTDKPNKANKPLSNISIIF